MFFYASKDLQKDEEFIALIAQSLKGEVKNEFLGSPSVNISDEDKAIIRGSVLAAQDIDRTIFNITVDTGLILPESITGKLVNGNAIAITRINN